MSLSECICRVTGQPGICDDEVGTCCCLSPIISIDCREKFWNFKEKLKFIEDWKKKHGANVVA